MGPQPPPDLARTAVRVGCPGEAEILSELLFSMQMVWCMLWGEWALTQPPRPRFGCTSPAGTAGFRYLLCPHPAMEPPLFCMETRSMSWVRAWGMWERVSTSRSPYRCEVARIRLSSVWQDKGSFVGVSQACLEALTFGGPAGTGKPNLSTWESEGWVIHALVGTQLGMGGCSGQR